MTEEGVSGYQVALAGAVLILRGTQAATDALM